MDKQNLFENLSRLALALEKQFGPDCEVVVHDLSRPENSIVCIAGNVTGRRIGGPLTDFVLGLLENDEHPDDTIGYSARTGDGRTLKSSTIFINDENSRPIGVFCINFDCTSLLAASQQIQRLTTAAMPLEVDKSFSADVPGLLQDMIRKSLRRVVGRTDLSDENGGINTVERRAVIADLEHQGAFRIRKATSVLAELFRVSRYTIYKDRQMIGEQVARYS